MPGIFITMKSEENNQQTPENISKEFYSHKNILVSDVPWNFSIIRI